MIFKVNETTVGIIENFPKGMKKHQVEQFAREKFKEVLDWIDIVNVEFEQDKRINFTGNLKAGL